MSSVIVYWNRYGKQDGRIKRGRSIKLARLAASVGEKKRGRVKRGSGNVWRPRIYTHGKSRQWTRSRVKGNMRVKWNTKWREASCVHVALSVKVVVTTSFPLYRATAYLSLVIYTFLFVSSTPHTTHPPSPRSSTPSPPDPPWHALYVRSRVLLLSRFCMQGEQPRRRTVASTRKREHERERKREILKRHKGRPHVLKGNNSFTTEADSTWSDVWKFVCLLATRPINFFPHFFSSIFVFPSFFFFFFLKLPSYG